MSRTGRFLEAMFVREFGFPTPVGRAVPGRDGVEGPTDESPSPQRPEAGPNYGVDEKYIGFKKLKGKLAHKKGVRNPGALAAAIGRKKYGSKGMARKSAAGRKR